MSNSRSEDEKVLVQKVEALMEATMSGYDPSHDALHVKRVRKTALSIAQTLNPQPDLLVVELAALMHDLADAKYVKLESGVSLAQHFAKTFSEIHLNDHKTVLDAMGEERLAFVAKIVENVSWTKEKKLRASVDQDELKDWVARCRELHCVQDADRLDAIGAFGIMRCAAYSAATNRPLYVPPEEEDAQDGKYVKGGSAIDHFHDKLLLIRERLKTDTGRKLGEKRHQLMLDFLKGVEDESMGI